MKNVITKGTEILNCGTLNKNKTTEFFPINEDYAMVIRVIGYLYGRVEGYKVWDINQTKKFYAVAKYLGKSGTPANDEIEIGSYVVFYRVGDFNSQGVEGFELHEENAAKSSFVCFVAAP